MGFFSLARTRSGYTYPPCKSTKLPTLLSTLRKALGRSHATAKAGTRSAAAMLFRILRNVVLLVEHRHQLFGDDARVLVVGGVVLGGTIGEGIAPSGLRAGFRLIRPAARIDEYTDHHRDLPPVDQIVHHVLCAQIAVLVLERLPILEDH